MSAAGMGATRIFASAILVVALKGDPERMFPCFPHVASLDGRMMAAATSRDILERQMRQYRKSGGKEGVLGEFSATPDGLARMYVFRVGEFIRQTALLEKIRGEGSGGYLKIPPACEEMITGLKTLVADVKTSKGGAMRLSMSVEAASEGDAKILRGVLGASLAVAKRFGVKSADIPKEFADAVKRTSIGGQGSKIEVHCSDAEDMVQYVLQWTGCRNPGRIP